MAICPAGHTYIPASLLNSNLSSCLPFPYKTISLNLLTFFILLSSQYFKFSSSEYAPSPIIASTSIPLAFDFSISVCNCLPSCFSPVVIVAAVIILSGVSDI